MPVLVDVDRRRRAVVAAARRLIVTGGLGAVTFRNLAGELGCSTRVVTNYFPTMRDVLLATYADVAGSRAAERDTLFAGGGDAMAALEQILPIGEGKVEDWIVWLCFWTAALFDTELAEAHRRRTAATGKRIADWLHSAGRAKGDADAQAQSIMTTIYGIAVQAVLDPENWVPDVQRLALRQTIATIAAGAL